jgi:IS5 family transposase
MRGLDEATLTFRQSSPQSTVATAEWVNADARTRRTLDRVLVRGLTKVHAWALWVALAHNLMRTMGLVPHVMT